ncbi:sugar ABC transporter permease [candidate division KSB1 bacterium]|nr:sugar ABC transporter permease [candidate division KSB1 bacterium]RQW01634.1 MAG: sugar ABC transporter permease [candidate division KSB1 bacterium]
MSKKYDKIGYAFIAPYIIHLLVFTTFPLVFSFLLIFHRWDIISPMKWVGLDNFVKLSGDLLFFKSIGNTLIFLLIHIPLQIAISLFLAELLNQKIRFRGFFRASYFLPVVVSGVVITILWQQLYAQDLGVINSLLVKIGLKKLPWLTSTQLAMPSIAIMATWKNVGLYIILFLVGLQSIPKHMYDAADLEGASHWQKFRYITLPMINPTMIMVVILSTIGGFSLFIEPYIMTAGGPMNSTLSAMLYIYKQAFSFYHMGYAATLGFFFALIVFGIVILQKKVIEKDVTF